MVGWSSADLLRTEPVGDALGSVCRERRPVPPRPSSDLSLGSRLPVHRSAIRCRGNGVGRSAARGPESAGPGVAGFADRAV